LSVSQVAYRLHITATVAIPGAAVDSGSERADLHIRLQEDFCGKFPFTHTPTEFFYVSPNCDDHGQPTLRVGAIADGSYFVFLYGDGVRFAVDRSGREVWADWPETSSLEDAATYLMGPVLGYVLRRRGVVSLHASAVALGDRAIALVGTGGAGKSTTAAAFACLGYGVLSDDVVALADQENRFLVRPGYPRINLWPDSVRALFGSEEALPRITPTWEKRYLALNQKDFRFEARALPLGTIYLLSPSESKGPDVSIEAMTASAGMMTLVANTYVNHLLDAQMRQQEFDVLSGVIANVPVRNVRAAHDSTRVRELCEAIAADARKLHAPQSASAALGDS